MIFRLFKYSSFLFLLFIQITNADCILDNEYVYQIEVHSCHKITLESTPLIVTDSFELNGHVYKDEGRAYKENQFISGVLISGIVKKTELLENNKKEYDAYYPNGAVINVFLDEDSKKYCDFKIPVTKRFKEINICCDVTPLEGKCILPFLEVVEY